MRNRIIAALLAVGAVAAGLYAANIYTSTLVSYPVLSYSSNYTLNLNTTPNQAGVNHVSAQAVYSSSTLTTNSFTDGRAATGTVSVITTASLAAHAATNQITIAATNLILANSATDYLVVLTTQSLTSAVVTYNGNPLRQGHEWFVTATTSGTAANITTAINRFNGVLAARTGSTVNLTALPAGAAGNSKTLAVNVSSITLGGGLFGGGYNNRLAGAYLTINGRRYNQGGPWSVADTSSGTATSVAAMVNRLSGIKASAVGSVVYATATVANAAGNSFTFASSAPSYMTAASANFTGGLDNASVCLNGRCVVQGTDWTVGASTSLTAKAISDAIAAKSSLNSIVVSTWTGSVVYTTASVAGLNGDYTLTTNSANLSPSAATLTGGANSAFAGGPVISIPLHGYGIALGVVYSTSSAVTIAPLVNGATYYVGYIDKNDIALSSTAVQAQAGQYITLAAPGATGPHTFKLTPQAYSGTAGLAWYGSNDGSNFNPLDISSATITSPTTAPVSTVWDFGRINYKYLQLQVVAPTTGGLALTVTVNAQ